MIKTVKRKYPIVDTAPLSCLHYVRSELKIMRNMIRETLACQAIN